MISKKHLSTALILTLTAGWTMREVAHARNTAAEVASKTVNLDEIKMSEAADQGKRTGEIGIYLQGDTPGSKNFVTGRFVIDPGKSPHAPHTHLEEEVMVIESGTGEILCDGKTTKVGPGSIMYTTPMTSHGIVNTGKTPLAFSFIKWTDKHEK